MLETPARPTPRFPLKHRLTPKGGSIHGDKQKNCEKFDNQGQSQGDDHARLGSDQKAGQACQSGGQEPNQKSRNRQAKTGSGQETCDQSRD
jgi:hypothetical protein